MALLYTTSVEAQYHFTFNQDLKTIYQDISTLRISKAQSNLFKYKSTSPYNLIVPYLENYIDFYTVFIKEEWQDYKKFKENIGPRLSLMEKGDKNSPYFLFCRAEMILQIAVVKLKFNDKINAASDVYEAYKILEENKNRFPSFAENDKSLAIIYALAESIPSWVRQIIGVKGSVKLGTHLIQHLVTNLENQNSIYRDEALCIYAYILSYAQNKNEEAYQLIYKNNLDHKKNPLAAFVKASMAVKAGYNDYAIKVLSERPTSHEYLEFYYLDFLHGKCKLNRLDKDAIHFISSFILNFKGRHYIKEAYQKMAWYYLAIDRNRMLYSSYISKAKKKGQALIDEDIQAQNEAKLSQMPDAELLRIRLLFDGGYYTQANSILEKLNSKVYISSTYGDEYYYRYGRVLDLLQQYNAAIPYYNITIQRAKKNQYYSCSSAFYLGRIYEKLNNRELAITSYQKCLSLDGGGYNNSLHQKAKTALNRLTD